MNNIVLTPKTFDRIMSAVKRVEADAPLKGAGGYGDAHPRTFRLLFGVCLSVTGNEATLRPCVAANDSTPISGAADIICYITFPIGAGGYDLHLITVTHRYGYLPFTLPVPGANPLQRGILMPVGLKVGCTT